MDHLGNRGTGFFENFHTKKVRAIQQNIHVTQLEVSWKISTRHSQRYIREYHKIESEVFGGIYPRHNERYCGNMDETQ